MLSVVESKDRTVEIHKAFLATLKRELSEREVHQISYQGGNESADVYMHPDYSICFASIEQIDRFWNPFMLLNAASGKSIGNIIVEINFPFEINRKVGGVLLENENGELFLGHRGKVGGGRKGIGKNNFMQYYKGPIKYVFDGNKQTEVIIISALSSPNVLKNINTFVEIVDSFKNFVSQQKIHIERPNPAYGTLDENEYRAPYKLSEIIDAEMLHAKVVNSLIALLREKGCSMDRSREIDLYILNSKYQMTHIFEVKSSCDTQSVYTAIGQLEYHSAKQKDRVKKIAVFPDSISIEKKSILQKLDINLICFSNGESDFRFSNIDCAIEM